MPLPATQANCSLLSSLVRSCRLLLLQTIFCCVAATAVSGAVLVFFAWHGIPLSPAELVGEPYCAHLITQLGSFPCAAGHPMSPGELTVCNLQPDQDLLS